MAVQITTDQDNTWLDANTSYVDGVNNLGDTLNISDNVSLVLDQRALSLLGVNGANNWGGISPTAYANAGSLVGTNSSIFVEINTNRRPIAKMSLIDSILTVVGKQNFSGWYGIEGNYTRCTLSNNVTSTGGTDYRDFNEFRVNAFLMIRSWSSFDDCKIYGFGINYFLEANSQLTLTGLTFNKTPFCLNSSDGSNVNQKIKFVDCRMSVDNPDGNFFFNWWRSNLNATTILTSLVNDKSLATPRDWINSIFRLQSGQRSGHLSLRTHFNIKSNSNTLSKITAWDALGAEIVSNEVNDGVFDYKEIEVIRISDPVGSSTPEEPTTLTLSSGNYYSVNGGSSLAIDFPSDSSARPSGFTYLIDSYGFIPQKVDDILLDIINGNGNIGSLSEKQIVNSEVQTGVTKSYADAAALSDLSILDDLFDGENYFFYENPTKAIVGNRIFTANGSELVLHNNWSLILDSTATEVFLPDVATKTITIKAASLEKGTKFTTLKAQGTGTITAANNEPINVNYSDAFGDSSVSLTQVVDGDLLEVSLDDKATWSNTATPYRYNVEETTTDIYFRRTTADGEVVIRKYDTSTSGITNTLAMSYGAVATIDEERLDAKLNPIITLSSEARDQATIAANQTEAE